MSHSHVIEMIVIEAIGIVVTEVAELNEKNPVVMIAIVVNQIENQDETDRDREVKTEKGQNEADRENEKDLEIEKNENDDQEVEIGKIVNMYDRKMMINSCLGKIENDEADHVRENPKKYPTDQKKKDARNQNQRAAKKKIENLPIRKYKVDEKLATVRSLWYRL